MRKVIAGLMMLAASQGMVAAQESALVYTGTDGKLVYVKHANTAESNKDNVIPDFSNAGYMNGGVAVPVGQVPVKVTLSPQPSGEDRTRIQAAIDQVCKMTPDANGFRGAVLLKAGTYRLNDGKIPVLNDGYGYALNIWASGVVLRGEGQGTSGTLLYSDFAKNHTMITIESPSHSTSETKATAITTAYVGTGAKKFNVADASAYAVGDQILVKFTPNSTWLSSIKVNTYIKNPADYWSTEEYVIDQVRKITAKSGNTITVDAPIVQPLQTKYGGGGVVKYSKTGYLQKVGIEDLRIKGIEDGGDPNVSGDENRLRVAIRPRFLENSWIHGVTCARVSEACVMTREAQNVTVEECAYVDPRGPISGGWRYSFCLDAISTRVLFQRCFSDYGRHDFVTHARIPGPNVFVDCLSKHGLNVLGPHHRWAIGTLFDNIKASSSMEITEFASPSGGHAWCGAQTVGWNLECSSYVNDSAVGAQNYLIGSIGDESHGAVSHDGNAGVYRGYWEKSGPSGTHISGIRSLYFKQLEDRRGSAAVDNVTIPQQRTGTIYTLLASWAGNGPLTVDTQTVTFTSIAAEDGYLNESTETSNVGGGFNATGTGGAGLRIGDTTTKQQHKSVVSFNTSSLPDGAVIQSATLKLMRGAISGTPTNLGNIKVDIKGGSGFNNAAALSKEDFQAAADATNVATMSYPSANGTLSTGNLNATGLSKINKTGKTQLRIYFATDDDNDSTSDYIGFYPAENSTAVNRPVLEVTYQ